MSDNPTRAEVCVVACAEAWRGDGEILANPIGTIPTIGGRLAKATFEPSLVMTDGEALLVENIVPVGVDNPPKVVAGWNPYRNMFDIVWNGPRHIMMGATQLDRYGNQNLAFLGSYDKPSVQLLGFRGAPGNTINNKTSYWVPNHSPRVFVEKVDVVAGVGYDRARALGRVASRFHHLPRVVTNLCVFDFATDDNTMRLMSVHPGVTVDEVVAATGFDIVVPKDVAESRVPTEDELQLIRDEIDPKGLREQEVPS
ncbi:MAG: acyl CoA:acetate/3-ketoacid CoA transferase, beta subunit [Actinomycetia bacterium]|nr:acyl CoA:acetate/3-ketoacid CoA transferase, beta subunit [Actinomycetes bacterium]